MLLQNSFLFLAISAAIALEERPNYRSSNPINPRLRSSFRAQDSSTVTCYTNSNAAGSYQDYADYAESLGSYDNRFRSACMYGIWIWYDLEEYNTNDFNVKRKNICLKCSFVN